MTVLRSLPRGTVLVLALLALAGLASPLAAPPAPAPCSRVPLSPKPVWLSDAQWVPPVGRIFAVDAGLNRIISYARSGSGTPLPAPQNAIPPTLLAAANGRVLVKLVGGAVASIGPANPARRELVPSLQNVTTPAGRLRAINQWTAVDGSVLAFGYAREAGSSAPQEQFQAGLFRLSLTGASSGQLLQAVRSWDHYVVGYSFLTAIGPTGYFLNVDGKAVLEAIPAGGTTPTPVDGAVPEEFSDVPSIDAALMNGPADAPKLYERLEQLTMVAGIYGSTDGNLYLLARRPSPKTGTDWWLFRIDPRRGKILGKAHLPTTSAFLSLVFSPDAVFAFERSSLDALGNQDIDSMVVIPLALLQAAPPQGAEICPRLGD